MEEVLKLINATFVSLDANEVKECNENIKNCIEKELIPRMKDNCPLFKELYNGIAFGGSYYDGLKIESPNEFDLDIKFTLKKLTCNLHRKKNCNCIKICSSDEEGFLWYQVGKQFNENLTKNNFIDDDGYMRSDKILKTWFKGLLDMTLYEMNQNVLTGRIKKVSESGPALTLSLKCSFGDVNIDLVPAFTFGEEYWPNSFKRSSCEKKDFLLVPKTIKKDSLLSHRYWRASFQEQERKMIEGKEKLKPALRLLKKMRKSLIHNDISSYALKTLVLWDLENKSFDWAKTTTLSDGFKHLVARYQGSLLNAKIPYYWKKGNNLIDSNVITCRNFYGHICSKFNDIKQEPNNPYAIAKLILKEGTDEYNEIIAIMEKNDNKYNIRKFNSYAKMETILNEIDTKYLQVEDTLINSIINGKLIPLMNRTQNLFKMLYNGRTFVDENMFNSRIGYTFYLVLACDCKKEHCDCVIISKLSSKDKSRCLALKTTSSSSFTSFADNEHNISTAAVLHWLNNCFEAALEELSIIDCSYHVTPKTEMTSGKIKHNENIVNLTTTFSRLRPSLTLQISTITKTIDVDIVPALKVNFDRLPSHLHSKNDLNKNTIFLIPNATSPDKSFKYWWPCFYDQETELLKDRQALNKAFKLFKKTCNTLNHSEVSNYALKTILFWVINNNELARNSPVSKTFMHLLKKYKEALSKNKIPYYWRDQINLLESSNGLSDYYCNEIEQVLLKIIDQYNNNLSAIAKIVLGEDSPEYSDYLNAHKASDVCASDVQSVSSGASGSSRVQRNSGHTSFLSLDRDEWVSRPSNVSGNDRVNRHIPTPRRPQTNVLGNDRFNRNIPTPRRSQAQGQETLTTENNGNGWLYAAGAVGAAALIGFGIFSAVRNANRNND